MASKKIITVLGATGNQGASVVDIFLSDPMLKGDWAVRAVTRDPTKEAAQKLASRGTEVVSANFDDTASLTKAMTGAHTVFAVTNYWEKMDQKSEVQQGKNMVDAAKAAGVQHFIWSTLDNVNKLTNGALPNVYHFDGKAEVEDYARATPGLPCTFFLPGFYMSNVPYNMIRPTPPDNTWTFSLPSPATAPIPVFAAREDTGKFVKGIVLRRDVLLGARVRGATTYMSSQDMVDTFARVFSDAGKGAKFIQLPPDVYKDMLKQAMGFPDYVAQELLENMMLFDKFGYYGGASLDDSHAVLQGDKLTTWEEFLRTSPLCKDLK